MSKGAIARFALLLVVPAAPGVAYFLDPSPIWIFLISATAIAVLADWIRRATEQIAGRIGPAFGGLINVSFGSLAELVLALFVLSKGQADVVQAQITGSIIGTSLLGLGLAITVGSIGGRSLQFNHERASQLSTMLVLVLIALLLPTVFDLTERSAKHGKGLSLSDQELSIGVSVVLIVLYAANLIYTVVSRRDAFASEETVDAPAGWALTTSIGVLVAATAAIAWEADLVSGSLAAAAGALRIPKMFLGVIALALVGTVSDIFAATWFGRQGKMGLVLSICVGSSIQVALVVAPVLVLASWLMGHPMTLIFDNPLDLFAIAATAFIVNAIASDRETNWFEGFLLIGVYILLGLGFFFVAPSA